MRQLFRQSKEKTSHIGTSSDLSVQRSRSKTLVKDGTTDQHCSELKNEKAEDAKSRWDKAYDNLRREKEDLVNDFEKILLSEPESGPSAGFDSTDAAKREKVMRSFVSKKLAAMDDKKWRLEVAGSSIEVRAQVDRLLKTILVAKDFISSVASMDPIHAGNDSAIWVLELHYESIPRNAEELGGTASPRFELDGSVGATD